MSRGELVQSVDRALRAVATVAGEPAGLPLGELAGRLGLKPTTLHNLARTLVAHGWLAKVGSPPLYRLGPAPGQLLAASEDAAETPLPLLRAVVERCPWAEVLFVEEVAGAMPVVLRLGPQSPGLPQRPHREYLAPYSSASCLAMQAFASYESLAAIRRRFPFAEFGRGDWESAAALEGFLEEVRVAGVCVPPTADADLFRAAVPVRDTCGVLRGVLGASCREPTTARRGGLLAALRACRTR